MLIVLMSSAGKRGVHRERPFVVVSDVHKGNKALILQIEGNSRALSKEETLLLLHTVQTFVTDNGLMDEPEEGHRPVSSL